MASNKQFTVYWDSCVFLSWLNEHPDRVSVIGEMWKHITEEQGGVIVTSALSIAEVSHSEKEKRRQKLYPDVERRIRAMWQDPKLLIVEVPSHIMHIANKLMREGIERGWSLKPYDAIHFATAKFVENSGRLIQEFNTYDEGLFKYKTTMNMTICNPHYEPQPRQSTYIDPNSNS